MEKVSQKSRKENSCFNYEKRLLLEGYLYWVHAAYIPGVSRSALPNQGVKYRAKSSPSRFRRPKCAEHSIDTRPEEVMDRKTFGHWEIDTIHGGTHTSTQCLFTMTERNCRLRGAFGCAGCAYCAKRTCPCLSIAVCRPCSVACCFHNYRLFGICSIGALYERHKSLCAVKKITVFSYRLVLGTQGFYS